MNRLEKYSDHAYAALRFMSGWMFAVHGAQKMSTWFQTGQPALASQIWLGGLIELAGGLLIAAGFKTRPAAFLCSGTMAVAYVQFHWKGQLNSAFLPAVNKGEMAVLYCFIFLYVACRGGGAFSADAKK